MKTPFVTRLMLKELGIKTCTGTTPLVITVNRLSIPKIIFAGFSLVLIFQCALSTQAQGFPVVRSHYLAAFNGVEFTSDFDNYAYSTSITTWNESDSIYQQRFSILNGFILEVNQNDYVQFVLGSQTDLTMLYTCKGYHVILFQDVNQKVLEWHVVAHGDTLLNPFNRLDKPLPQPAQGPLKLINKEDSWIHIPTGDIFLKDTPVTESRVYTLKYHALERVPVIFEVLSEEHVTWRNLSNAEGTFFNDVLTLETEPFIDEGENRLRFSHWLFNGEIRSYENTYTFTLLGPTVVEAVYVSEMDKSLAHITLSDRYFINEGYDSLVGQFSLDPNAQVIEYGFLISNRQKVNLTFDEHTLTLKEGKVQSVVIGDTLAIPSERRHPLTGEFIASFKQGTYQSVASYVIYWEEGADPLDDTPTVLVSPTRLAPLTLDELHHMALGTYLTQGYISHIDSQFVLIEDELDSIRVEINASLSMDRLHEYVELTIEKTHLGLHLVRLEQKIDTKESYTPVTFTLPEEYNLLLSCEARIVNLEPLTVLAMTEMRRHYTVEVARGCIKFNITLPKQLNNAPSLYQALTLAMNQGPVTLTHVLCLSGTNLTFTSHSIVIDVP